MLVTFLSRPPTSVYVQMGQTVPQLCQPACVMMSCSARLRFVTPPRGGVQICSPVHTNPPPLCEHQQAHTPLQRAQFLSKLQHHPNKAWVSWLLSGINYGIAIGYTGTQCHQQTHYLTSAAVHVGAIDNEFRKELAVGIS